MQKRSLILLMALTAFAVVLAVATLAVGGAGGERVGTDQRALPALSAELGDVASVEVHRAGLDLTFVRDGDNWLVAQKSNYPADPGKIRRIVLALADMSLVEPKTSKPELYPRLEVEDPGKILAITFTMYAIAEMRHRVANDFALIPAFIEEILRVDGPVPFAPRVTTEEVEVAGRFVPKDTTVMLSYGSADRDPRRYQDADEVHLDSKVVHFAFGRGPHRCLGSHLARLELRLILEEWHSRIPEYTLAQDKPPQIPWPTGTMSLQSVPLTIKPPERRLSRPSG